MTEAKRRYLPAEAYRFMVLAALAHRRGAGASKGDLAWETRANHYMLTRVLRELHEEGHVALERAGDGYRIQATASGLAFLEAHRGYAATTFRENLGEHFRYGTAPAWAKGLLADPS